MCPQPVLLVDFFPFDMVTLHWSRLGAAECGHFTSHAIFHADNVSRELLMLGPLLSMQRGCFARRLTCNSWCFVISSCQTGLSLCIVGGQIPATSAWGLTLWNSRSLPPFWHLVPPLTGKGRCCCDFAYAEFRQKAGYIIPILGDGDPSIPLRELI